MNQIDVSKSLCFLCFASDLLILLQINISSKTFSILLLQNFFIYCREARIFQILPGSPSLSIFRGRRGALYSFFKRRFFGRLLVAKLFLLIYFQFRKGNPIFKQLNLKNDCDESLQLEMQCQLLEFNGPEPFCCGRNGEFIFVERKKRNVSPLFPL